MKKSLLFDGRDLVDAIEKGMARSGIFFVTFNILKQFLQSDVFDITILTRPFDTQAIKKIVKEELGYDVKCYFDGYKYLEKLAEIHIKRVKYKKDKKYLLKKYWGIMEKIHTPSYKSDKFFDLYFSPKLAFLPEIRCNNRFLILHDAIPLIFPKMTKDFEKKKGWFFEVADALNGTDNYFTVSQYTKNDFLKLIPQLKSEQITVTPLAAADSFHHVTGDSVIKAVRKKYNIPENKKYVFSLCTLDPRKNLIRAVKTFVQFVKKNNIGDLVFVLGGGAWKSFLPQLENELGKLPENLIIKAGYIDDEDLSALYSGAEWFVYTSMYEGFGLPPLEAMQCGCPVITSNNSSLPEVVGNAGIMIDWDSDEQHVAAYEQYYFNGELRKQNVEQGLKRAKMFSWYKCADIMIKKMSE